jgi:glycolate oxidase
MEKMDPTTAELIRKVKRLLDPQGIMNPGNWEKA